SLQPTNINIQIHPGYEHVITLTPTEAGEFGIVCNEFCGIGHHTMVGRVIVVDSTGRSVADNSTAIIGHGGAQ
ncbi:MAG TPA: hypothetical protein VL383_10725, partial [Gemmatimonadaceae bacterium]|nr:hypothetical protein [Gemmatimonadaceae bacterium]